MPCNAQTHTTEPKVRWDNFLLVLDNEKNLFLCCWTALLYQRNQQLGWFTKPFKSDGSLLCEKWLGLQECKTQSIWFWQGAVLWAFFPCSVLFILTLICDNNNSLTEGGEKKIVSIKPEKASLENSGASFDIFLHTNEIHCYRINPHVGSVVLGKARL